MFLCGRCRVCVERIKLCLVWLMVCGCLSLLCEFLMV